MKCVVAMERGGTLVAPPTEELPWLWSWLAGTRM